MGFDDRMTVAAIGGGHAFGKSHGPCKTSILSESGNELNGRVIYMGTKEHIETTTNVDPYPHHVE